MGVEAHGVIIPRRLHLTTTFSRGKLDPMKTIGTKYSRLDKDTHRLIRRISEDEGWTFHGTIRIMALFYKEWREKMENFVDERSKHA